MMKGAVSAILQAVKEQGEVGGIAALTLGLPELPVEAVAPHYQKLPPFRCDGEYTRSKLALLQAVWHAQSEKTEEAAAQAHALSLRMIEYVRTQQDRAKQEARQ